MNKLQLMEIIAGIEINDYLNNAIRKSKNNGWTPTSRPVNDRRMTEKGCIKDNTPNRNDLCPCGSGRKYKKCHNLI